MMGSINEPDQNDKDTGPIAPISINEPTPSEPIAPMSPVIVSVTPDSVPEGVETLIEVVGENFTNKSIVYLDDTGLVTEFVSTTALRAQFDDSYPADDYALTVKDGDLVSEAAMFMVT